MICVRALVFACLASHAVETAELTESVSLLQTGVTKKKQGPNIVPLVLGPPWAEADPAAFNAMKAEGIAMVNRTALELDLTDKEAEGELGKLGGMRFSLAGTHEGKNVDLLVTGVTKKEADKDEALEKYNSGKLKKGKGSRKGDANGLYRGFARIFVKADSTQKLKLSVVEAGTTKPLKIPLLAVTFFGLGGLAKGKKFATSVSDCNTDLVSEFWAAPSVANETKGGCGGVSFRGTGALKPNGKSDPLSVAEVGDADCANSLVLKWFDAEEISLDLSAGSPASKKGIPFLFKVGLTQCDVTWEPPPTKAELRAAAKEKKMADMAEKKKQRDAEKQKAKEAKDAEKQKEKEAKLAAKKAKR